MRDIIKSLLILAWLILFFLGGTAFMQYSINRHMQQDAERESKILAWIVQRNPNATIKDFSDFPHVLLVESERVGIDYRLVMALIDKESNFNPRAVGPAGEIGLMQVLPTTAKLIATNLKLDYIPPTPKRGGGYADLGTLGTPSGNLRIALAHLKDQVDKFGMGPVALRAYNRGDAAARQHRPHDRYAEDIGLKLVALIGELK